MAQSKHKKNGRASLVFYMLFTLLTAACVLSYMDLWASSTLPDNLLEFEGWDVPGMSLWTCLTFGAMGFARLFRAARERGKANAQSVFHLISGIALLTCAALAGMLGYTRESTTEITVVFCGVLAMGRVLSIARNRRWWNILLNVLLILSLGILAIAAFAMPSLTFIFSMVTAAIVSILSMMEVIFSRIRLDILKEIVQQTYIVEVIMGLLLLMIAFSFALKLTDEAFPTFWDGLWYCFAVVTTIGFGDITPTTLVGRAMTVVLGVYGIVVVALLTSIVVNFYGEMKRVKADESAGESEPPKETEA